MLHIKALVRGYISVGDVLCPETDELLLLGPSEYVPPEDGIQSPKRRGLNTGRDDR
jgi:hypothetical protein